MSDENEEKIWSRLFVVLALLVLAILIYLTYRSFGVPGAHVPIEETIAPHRVESHISTDSEKQKPESTRISTTPDRPESITLVAPEDEVAAEKPREISPPTGYTQLKEPCSGTAGNAVELFIGIYTECPDQVYGYSIKTY